MCGNAVQERGGGDHAAGFERESAGSVMPARVVSQTRFGADARYKRVPGT